MGQPATLYRILKDVEPLSREKERGQIERLKNNQKVTDPNRSKLSDGYGLCYLCGSLSILGCFSRAC